MAELIPTPGRLIPSQSCFEHSLLLGCLLGIYKICVLVSLFFLFWPAICNRGLFPPMADKGYDCSSSIMRSPWVTGYHLPPASSSGALHWAPSCAPPFSLEKPTLQLTSHLQTCLVRLWRAWGGSGCSVCSPEFSGEAMLTTIHFSSLNIVTPTLRAKFLPSCNLFYFIFNKEMRMSTLGNFCKLPGQ